MNKIILRLLECAVCLEKFNQPICLDCGHVFCLECIISIQNNAKELKLKNPICPLCRKSFKSRRKHFWKTCIPIVQIIDSLKENTESTLDFNFEIDLENLPEEVLKKIF